MAVGGVSTLVTCAVQIDLGWFIVHFMSSFQRVFRPACFAPVIAADMVRAAKLPAGMVPWLSWTVAE